MTEDSFKTIGLKSEGIYKEKGSKFLAFAFPVTTEDQIKNILAELKKEYYDARHICYAYILGPKKDIYKAIDAGEPAHTAGDPILNEIKSAGLTDILVVVVRYFGGTKLGKSGLISAYREAAENALKNAKIITKSISKEITIKFTYPQTGELLNLINQLQGEILHQTFETICTITIAVKLSKFEEARKKLERFLV